MSSTYPAHYHEMKQPAIQTLSNELLRLILDQIEPDPDKTVPIDRRQFLSVESFDRPPPSSRGSIKDIGRFRCVCKRFADVGEPLLFTRVAARFSRHGLEKLRELAEWPHLARHVKKFSYLVPYFYVNGKLDREGLLLPVIENESISSDVAVKLRRKAREQLQILQSGDDLQALKSAIASFTSLQFIQLLRVTEQEDDTLLNYINQRDDPRALLEWAPACSHSSRTIGEALLFAQVPWSKFSSPMLSPQSATFLLKHQPRSVSTLAARLTCLTLHFDDGNDMDELMRDLSDLFKTVFRSAEGMQAVHVGFPSHRPLSLPLEAVFHNVTWKRLVAFGIQGWKLNADEILDLASRHADRLKGLRLRDVYLKEDSMWKDVLEGLRDSMHRLEWVSLRRIGYVQHFDDLLHFAGGEIPDDPAPGLSDSDEDEEENDPLTGSPTLAGPANGHSSDEEDFESDSNSDSEDERGPDANEMEFPDLNSPTTPASAPWCNRNGHSYGDTTEALGDDGGPISNARRKAWEKWVTRRCPEHGDG